MAAITSAAVSAGVAGYQIYQGEQAKKKAKAAMNEYERADLENAFEDMQVSTLGSDLMREELNRNSASFVDALQQGGARMVTAGLPRVQSGLISSANEARNYLDNQVITRDKLIAGDNVNLRGVRENRDMQNMAGISSMYNAGQQDSMNGVLGVVSSMSRFGRTMDATNQSVVNNPNVEANAELDSMNVIPGASVERIANSAIDYSTGAPSIYNPITDNYPTGNNPGYLAPIQGKSLDAFNYTTPNPYMIYDENFGEMGRRFITRDSFKTNV